MDENDIQRVRRPWLRGWRIAAGALLIILLGAFIILWSIRVRLATDYVDREFARRGVQASYEVKRIGFGTQVIENLVIGDPRRPDATVRELRVQVLVGITGARVGLITARGVRMRGRIVDGRLTMGQIDRLLPPPSGLPFRLPDQRVDLADAAILLDTPAGRVALGLAGRGNLSDGFRGEVAAVARRLRLGTCTIDAARAQAVVAVDDLRPSFRGPAALAGAACGPSLAVARSSVDVNVAFTPALDAWRGDGRLAAGRIVSGPSAVAGVRGPFTFAGNADDTQGRIRFEAQAAAVREIRAERTDFAGAWRFSARRGELIMTGDVAAHDVSVRDDALAGFARALRSGGGTPLDPIGRRLADAIVRAGRGGASARGRLRLASGPGQGGIALQDLRVETAGGARLAATGGGGIAYRWPSGRFEMDGTVALAGGGFPDARFDIRQAGGALEGVGRIAPIAVGGARLELAEIRFTRRPGGTRFATSLRLDGPVAGGRVDGLVLPVRGRFGRDGLAIGEGCVAASFRALRIEGLSLGPSRLPLCPVGPALVWQPPGGAVRAGAELRRPVFAGRLGQSPIRLAADRIRAGTEGFAASDLAVRLGPDSSVTRLAVASLDARFVDRGVSGNYSGLSGKIANVPLLLSEGGGRWQVVRGDVLLQGRLTVADEVDPPRFYPLVSDDFRLTLADNRIRATGWLANPASGVRVAQAAVDHHLRTGAGEAVLDVPGITFTESFQPERLTRLTTGVVALVDGTLTGQGRISWGPDGTRSTGVFATEGMNLAAPFGPVEGLTTSIEFTDLLGLTSAPGQVARVGLVRAGIDVYDGIVGFQLRPNYHVQVESGRWPFAGGELILEPSLLDFSRPSTKYLTFRVVGMDAARFIQQMEFSNISATGTFDGIIPMRFGRADETGRILSGEIVDGRLIARPPGGTLSYVGELTDRDLGPYGILAFNALKSLRYDRFDVTLNGALDGEFITVVDLDGVARDPSMTTLPSGGGLMQIVAGRVLRQVARIPFEFNIRIEGRFRALIATARSFSDPSDLLQAVLPGMLRDRATETTTTDVQDEESENEP